MAKREVIHEGVKITVITSPMSLVAYFNHPKNWGQQSQLKIKGQKITEEMVEMAINSAKEKIDEYSSRGK